MTNKSMTQEQWASCIQNEPEAIRIDYYSGGRSVFVILERDAEVIARAFGGPLYSFGEQIRWPGPTVNAWRSPAQPDLHAKILKALVDVGFPNVPLEPLYPDERPSSFQLTHRSGIAARISAPSRFFEDKPILAALARELDKICYATQTTPPTHQLPNPDVR